MPRPRQFGPSATFTLGVACALAAAEACSSERFVAVRSGLTPPDAGVAAPPAMKPPPAPPAPAVPHTARRLRRLSNFEIENVITDLLGERLDVTRGFLPDARVEGYDTDVIALGVSDSKIDELATAADRVASYLTAPAHLARLAPCPAEATPAACARAFAQRFATSAWGRPPDEAELTRLAGVFQIGSAPGDDGNEDGPPDYAGGVALVAEAVLQSPHFLYRSELGEPAAASTTAGAPLRLTGLEIASALSFLIRGSRPDDALLAAAGTLADPQARTAQARRLLARPEARAHVRRFLRAWLGLEGVAWINKDLAIFPEFTPSVRWALDREVETFFSHVLDHSSGRLDELVLADYSFPAPELAPLYGNDALDPLGAFTKTRLALWRRGVLSSPAFLAAHALVNQSNPIDRGLVVRTRLFCQDVAPPPTSAAIQTPTGKAGSTTREKYAQHANDPRCRPCHDLMDPIGFGFEMYDAIGRVRFVEAGQDVDSSGALTDTDVDGAFNGPAELSLRLADSAQFRRCFTQQLWRFAEGRAAAPGDERDVDELAEAFARADRRIDDLMLALVSRPNFVLRLPGEAAP